MQDKKCPAEEGLEFNPYSFNFQGAIRVEAD